MKNALVLVASANPVLWQDAKEALGQTFAVAFSLDLAGSLDVMRKHRPAAVLFCSQLLDRCRPEALGQLAEACRDGTEVIVLSAAGKAADPQRVFPLQPSAWLAQSLVASSLGPLVRNLLGRRRSVARVPLARSGSAGVGPSAMALGGKGSGSAPAGGAATADRSLLAPSPGGAITPVPAAASESRGAVITAPGAASAPSTSPSRAAGDPWRPAGADSSAIYRPMVVGKSPVMKRVMEVVRRVAATEATVLISGESGVGKEVLARWLHCASPRRAGPFQTADLPAIPDELFESILFGHEKGAFTGAEARNQGKFRRAQHGTLFLDEISSLKLTLQPKLLRALQEKQVETVGGRELTSCDVRIIAATNIDLAAAVRRGEFRTDLFHRLNVFNIVIPPLRDRLEDFDALCALFLQRYADESQTSVPTISPEGMAALRRHHWPGNVRELENRIQRAVLLSPSEIIGPEALFSDGEASSSVAQGSEPCFAGCELPLEQLEQLYIKHILDRCDGNQSRAAQILAIDRKTLRAKLLRACDGADAEAIDASA